MGQLLSRLEPRMTAVARRLTRDPDAAADVVQNAFVKILRHCEQFRGGSLASTWTHRIVVNEALMWLRSEGRRSPSRLDVRDWDLAFGSPRTPEHEVEQRQQSACVRRALAALSAEDRQLLWAKTFEGRAYVELGRELGISKGAIKSRAFRARRRLLEELERVQRPRCTTPLRRDGAPSGGAP